MKVLRCILSTAAIASVVFDAACSRQTMPAIPQQTQSVQRSATLLSPGNTSPLAFVSDNAANAFYIFNINTLQHIGTNTNVCRPQGLASDANGNLYENDLCTQTIQVFAPPYTGKPTATLNDKNYFGYAVSLDKRGNVYVANNQSAQHGPGNIAFFDAKKHFRILTRGGPFFFAGVAVDSQGRIWVAGTDFFKTPMTGYFQTLTSGFSNVYLPIATPGAIAFDNHGNLVIDDQTGAENRGSELLVFPPGQTKPSARFPLQTDGSDLPYFAFSSGFQKIVVPDLTTGKVYLYAYPSGKLLGTFKSSQVKAGLGAAVVPAAGL